jgi:nitrogen fixation/metabolism regulation signal transduction histidine kinase
MLGIDNDTIERALEAFWLAPVPLLSVYLVSLGAVSTLVWFVKDSHDKGEIRSLKQEKSFLERKLENVQGQVASLQAELDNTQQQVRQQEAIIQQWQTAPAPRPADMKLFTELSQANVAVSSSLANVTRVVTDMGHTLDFAPGKFTVIPPSGGTLR